MSNIRVFTVLVWLFSWEASAQLCERWVLRSPLPTSHSIHDVLFDGSSYWAVGEFGLIMTSQDGTDWAFKESGTTLSLSSIVKSPSGFMVVGDTGIVLMSSNGDSWQEMTVLGENLNDVAWGEGLYVLVGDNTTIYTTADGITYSQKIIPTEEHYQSVIYDGTDFLALGSDGLISKSTDGDVWTNSEIPGAIGNLLDLEYMNENYIAVGRSGTVYSSPDGITWVDQTPGESPTMHDSFYWNNWYYIVGLSLKGSPTTPTNFNVITYFDRYIYETASDGNQLLAVGQGGIILESIDASNWAQNSIGTHKILFDAVYGDDRFVGVGDLGVTTVSLDHGATWQLSVSGTDMRLMDITYFNSMFIAVGASGTIITSPDGINWAPQASGTTKILNTITHNGAIAVTVGVQQTLLYSTDGTTWNQATIPAGAYNLYGVGHGSSLLFSRFIAVGTSGLIIYSYDGMTWSTATSSGMTTWDLLSVASAGTYFVTVGHAGTLLYSHYGLEWTSQESHSGDYLHHVTFNNGYWRVLTNSGVMITSPNGTVWTTKTLNTSSNLKGSAANGDTQLIFGDSGLILQRETISAYFADWPEPYQIDDLVAELNTLCE